MTQATRKNGLPEPKTFPTPVGRLLSTLLSLRSHEILNRSVCAHCIKVNIMLLVFSFYSRYPCRRVKIFKLRVKCLLASLDLSLYWTSTSWDAGTGRALIETLGGQYGAIYFARFLGREASEAVHVLICQWSLLVIGFHRLCNEMLPMVTYIKNCSR